MTIPKLCSVLTVVALNVVGQTAGADANTDADALKKEGFSRLAAGDYANGITAMEKAYTLQPAPAYLLNIAIAYDLWSGHCAESRAAFERFFSACRASSCSELKMAEERSARVRDKCEVGISVRTNPSGSTIAIDGKEAGKSPIDLKAGPGTHELTATLEGYSVHSETLTLVEGRPQSLSIALREVPKVADAHKPPPALTAPAITQASAPRDDEGGLLSSPLFWIVTGAAVVGGGVALALVLGSGTTEPSGGSLGTVFGGP